MTLCCKNSVMKGVIEKFGTDIKVKQKAKNHFLIKVSVCILPAFYALLFGKGDMMKEFDLNIEKILENWEVHHAIREIIANALDEQMLTNTADIDIIKTVDNCWHIVDYGRGLNYHHLTQNENEEKLNNEKLIGKFGVGLKDALATLYRHGILVSITSKYGVITLKQTAKAGFDDIITLHAVIDDSPDPSMAGTDFCLDGCTEQDVEKAKSLFLVFSGEVVLEETDYGEVVSNNEDNSNIYINGVKVAEENNFLFSYNITSLTKQLKKALNRERTNVGRTAYTPRIKDILKNCSSENVIRALTSDLKAFGFGNIHDEMTWNEIQFHASVELQHISEKSTFVTTKELEETPSMIDEIKRNGLEPIVVPANLIDKMVDYNKGVTEEQKLRTTTVYRQEEEKKFVPEPIDIATLTDEEKNVYIKLEDILQLIGGRPEIVNSIEIVEKLYESELFLGDVVGLWIPEERRILIKRTQLKSIHAFAGTLLHECAHAMSGADDVSRDFERKLTDLLGMVAELTIR